jgi:hypothetical protein
MTLPAVVTDSEESSLTPTRRTTASSSRRTTGRNVPVHYEKVFHGRRRRQAAQAPARAPGAGRRDGARLQLHRPADPRRTENSTLYEVARDTSALRNLTRTWFERSPRRSGARRPVLLRRTTVIHCHTPATVYAKRDATRTCATSSAAPAGAGRRPRWSWTTCRASAARPRPGTRLLLATAIASSCTPRSCGVSGAVSRRVPAWRRVAGGGFCRSR